jgi:signal transduction histidine kinase
MTYKADPHNDLAELYSATAHELKGPLTTLTLRLQSVRRAAATSAGLDDGLEACEKQVRRLDRLIESMLSIGRIARGCLELEASSFDLAELVRDRARALERVRADINGPIEGVWDRRQVEHIVDAALASALRYAARDAVVSVRAHDSGGEVSVGVSLNATIVEIDMSPRGDFQLFVAQRLSEALGGSVDVRSSGVELVLTITLPRSEA